MGQAHAVYFDTLVYANKLKRGIESFAERQILIV